METDHRASSAGIFPLAGIVLLLQIPLLLMVALVYNRQDYRDQAVGEVGRMWGSEQTLGGPMLVVPYPATIWNEREKRREDVVRCARLLPHTLNVTGKMESQVRRRGIFEVPLYQSTLDVEGEFRLAGLPTREDYWWHEAFASVYVADPRGIQSNSALSWNGASLPFSPGIQKTLGSGTPGQAGIHAPVAGLLEEERIRFSFQLQLNGSLGLYLLPLGNETQVRLQSDWETPAFQGAWLPFQHRLQGEGFEASWSIPALGRNFPQYWESANEVPRQILQSGFGVELLSPVDSYRMVIRSLKYEILFFVLTFAVFWLFQVLGQSRIHPMQYLLVGLALGLFYLLMLSLAGHLGFGFAYLLAAAATIALISAYSQAILGSASKTITVAAVLTALYGCLYVLLASQDYALLLGSLMLFLVLAAIMYLTRGVDWNRAFSGR